VPAEKAADVGDRRPVLSSVAEKPDGVMPSQTAPKVERKPKHHLADLVERGGRPTFLSVMGVLIFLDQGIV
jgi:hypothetical protein